MDSRQGLTSDMGHSYEGLFQTAPTANFENETKPLSEQLLA